MYLEYAVWSKDIRVIAELLDCGVDVNAVIESYMMDNALTCASRSKSLDVVRFLLQRGASADHVNRTGCGAGTLCWVIGDDLTRHSSMDVFNLLVEYTHIEMDDDLRFRSSTLCRAAPNATGAQMDTLISLGADVHLGDESGTAAIHHAALFGNYSTYSALASYYDWDIFKNNEFGSRLLFCAIWGRIQFANEPPAKLYRPPGRYTQHDQVMIDMLQRGVRPRKRLLVADSDISWGPPSVFEQFAEVDNVAAEFGPEAEAWYLSMLHTCDLLAPGGIERLREVAEAGHLVAGFVYELTGEPNEMDHNMRGDCEEDGDTPNLGQGGVYADVDGISRRTSINEADEANQFWDAEEIL
jgi:hypothetical protein